LLDETCACLGIHAHAITKACVAADDTVKSSCSCQQPCHRQSHTGAQAMFIRGKSRGRGKGSGRVKGKGKRRGKGKVRDTHKQAVLLS